MHEGGGLSDMRVISSPIGRPDLDICMSGICSWRLAFRRFVENDPPSCGHPMSMPERPPEFSWRRK